MYVYVIKKSIEFVVDIKLCLNYRLTFSATILLGEDIQAFEKLLNVDHLGNIAIGNLCCTGEPRYHLFQWCLFA